MIGKMTQYAFSAQKGIRKTAHLNILDRKSDPKGLFQEPSAKWPERSAKWPPPVLTIRMHPTILGFLSKMVLIWAKMFANITFL